MEISLNTPALLFPAISLLLLAYTNRFVALASLARTLHNQYKNGDDSETLIRQIRNLLHRINYIRYMQGLGVFSFLLCVVCMYCIYNSWLQIANYIFALSLLSLLISLIVSLLEITQSMNAIKLELSDIEGLRGNIFTDFFTKTKTTKP